MSMSATATAKCASMTMIATVIATNTMSAAATVECGRRGAAGAMSIQSSRIRLCLRVSFIASAAAKPTAANAEAYT
jgi:hypothetical protein